MEPLGSPAPAIGRGLRHRAPGAIAAWVLSSFSNVPKVTGTALPPNLLLAAKLVVCLLLWKGYVVGLHAPWLPMWPIFDAFPPVLVRWALILAFGLGALALLTNHAVRTAAVVCGVVFLLEPVVSRVEFYFGNWFCGCLLFLIGMYRGPVSLRVLHAQFSVMYFGSGLNKLLDPDWRSGHFMDYWMISRNRHEPLIGTLDAWMPGESFALSVSWGTILIELALAVLFLMPRRQFAGVLLAIGFHGASVLLTGSGYGIFVPALLFSFVVFVPWPASVSITYASSSLVGRGCRRISRWSDFDGLFRWGERRTDAGAAGTPPPWFELVCEGGRCHGWLAVLTWILLNPISYFGLASLVARLPP